MRLIDASKIMLHKDMVHNIDGCMMVRVEDVQRLITEQPTAFDINKFIEQIYENGVCSGNEKSGFILLNKLKEIIERIKM